MKATSRVPVFQERIRELRGDMTQGQFAEKIGVSRPTIGLYESGARIPDAEVLRDISEKCDVSADWLLGLTETKLRDAELQNISRYTGLTAESILNIQLCARFLGIINFILSDTINLPLVCDAIAEYKTQAEAIRELTNNSNEPIGSTQAKTLRDFEYSYYDLFSYLRLFINQVADFDTIRSTFLEKQAKNGLHIMSGIKNKEARKENDGKE